MTTPFYRTHCKDPFISPCNAINQSLHLPLTLLSSHPGRLIREFIIIDCLDKQQFKKVFDVMKIQNCIIYTQVLFFNLQ